MVLVVILRAMYIHRVEEGRCIKLFVYIWCWSLLFNLYAFSLSVFCSFEKWHRALSSLVFRWSPSNSYIFVFVVISIYVPFRMLFPTTTVCVVPVVCSLLECGLWLCSPSFHPHHLILCHSHSSYRVCPTALNIHILYFFPLLFTVSPMLFLSFFKNRFIINAKLLSLSSAAEDCGLGFDFDPNSFLF